MADKLTQKIVQYILNYYDYYLNHVNSLKYTVISTPYNSGDIFSDILKSSKILEAELEYKDWIIDTIIYMSRVNAQIIWDEATGMYKVQFPYLKEFVDFIKLIPASNRDYDPKTYTWFVYEKYFEPLKSAMKNKWPNAFFMEKEKVEQFSKGTNQANINLRGIPSVEQDLTTLASLSGHKYDELRSLKYVDALKIYRRTALKYHPDRNPSGAIDMARLNESWQRLKESHYKD